jgi:hypothetical protein
MINFVIGVSSSEIAALPSTGNLTSPQWFPRSCQQPEAEIAGAVYVLFSTAHLQAH